MRSPTTQLVIAASKFHDVRMTTPVGSAALESAGATDEISSGPSGGDGWRPPRRLIAGALGVALVTAGVWVSVAGDHPPQRQRSGAVRTGGPSDTAPPRSAAARRAAAAPRPTPTPSLPVAPVGVPLPVPSGLRLPFTGTVPGWWDVDAGDLSDITPAPPPQKSGFSFFVIPRAAGFAALRPAEGRCDGCPGNPQPVELVSAGGTARPGPLGHRIAAGANGNGIWVTTYRSPAVSTADTRQFAVVQQIDLAGRVLTAPRRLPAGSAVIRGVRGGLLLSDARRKEPMAYVWEPFGRRTVLRIGGPVIDATSDRVAWQDSGCTPAVCTVHVTDLTTGLRRDYAGRVGQMPQEGGAISPDGRYLALLGYGDPTPGDRSSLSSVAVAVIDLHTGAELAVPGSKVDSGHGFFALGWSPDSRFLVLEAGQQAALWRVGAPELWLPRPLPVDAVVVPS